MITQLQIAEGAPAAIQPTVAGPDSFHPLGARATTVFQFFPQAGLLPPCNQQAPDPFRGSANKRRLLMHQSSLVTDRRRPWRRAWTHICRFQPPAQT